MSIDELSELAAEMWVLMATKKLTVGERIQICCALMVQSHQAAGATTDMIPQILEHTHTVLTSMLVEYLPEKGGEK